MTRYPDACSATYSSKASYQRPPRRAEPAPSFVPPRGPATVGPGVRTRRGGLAAADAKESGTTDPEPAEEGDSPKTPPPRLTCAQTPPSGTGRRDEGNPTRTCPDSSNCLTEGKATRQMSNRSSAPPIGADRTPQKSPVCLRQRSGDILLDTRPHRLGLRLRAGVGAAHTSPTEVCEIPSRATGEHD